MEPRQFHPFRRLPPELKSMIWEESVHDEYGRPGVQFFTLYTKPGYLCDCGVCSNRDVNRTGVSVSLPNFPSSTARRRPQVRDKFLHQRYTMLAENPRYVTQNDQWRRAFSAAVPLAASREFADFERHRDAYLSTLEADQSSYPRVFADAKRLAIPMVRPAALAYHAVPSQELGIPACSGSCPGSTNLPGNPSTYLMNGDLWNMGCLARRSVMMYREKKQRKMETGVKKDASVIVPLEALSPSVSIPELHWNARQDLICLRPEKTDRGVFAADLGDLAHIPLIRCMLRYGRQVSLAIEFDPGWLNLEDLGIWSVYYELINLTNSVLCSLPTREAKERVLYFIDWRICPLNGTSVDRLGAPSYEGQGVKFYEVVGWTSRLRDFQLAPHGEHFCFPGSDILSLIRCLSHPGNLSGQRHISFRILATIRT